MPSLSVRTILENTQLFQAVTERWRNRLAQLARLEHYAAGKLIFSEGESVPGLYCVGTGLIRVVKDNPTGKQFVLHFAHPGQTFGEVAVFGDFAAPTAADAVEDSICAVIPRKSLQALLLEHHDLCLELLGSTARWVRSLVELIDGIVLRDAGSRVARYLYEVAPSDDSQPFELGVLKKDLAAHLNLTQETLSRTLRKLVDAELIESYPNGTVQLRNRIGLHEVAEAGFAT
jgi:CRP/FNR family transcriptional regulator